MSGLGKGGVDSAERLQSLQVAGPPVTSCCVQHLPDNSCAALGKM